MKFFKRAATFCIAAAMTISLGETAFAVEEPTGNLTVTVPDGATADKYVFAVRMFTAEANSNDGYMTFTDYELEDNWLPFFEKKIEVDPEASKKEKKEAALAYVEALTQNENGDAAWAAFAGEAKDWLYQEKFCTLYTNDYGVQLSNIAENWENLTFAEKARGAVASFNNLPSGYYIVFPEGGSTGKDNRGTDAMLINIPTDYNNTQWTIKSTFPTVEKKVDTDNTGPKEPAEDGSAQVGAIVTFTLISAVPDMSGYDSFYFAFKDKLNYGLQVVDHSGKVVEHGTLTDQDLTVTIGGKPVTTGYTAKLEGNGMDLNVEFTDLQSVPDIKVDDPIVVTYQAMITEEALEYDNARNTVLVEYSNDPNAETHSVSLPDISSVYIFDVSVHKWADDMETYTLPGAEFVLSTSNVAPTAEQIKEDYKDYTGLVKLVESEEGYRVAKPNDTDAVNSFTTIEEDDILISGLGEGTYYLHEVKAPEGYNKLKNPIEITITVTDFWEGTADVTVTGNGAEIATASVVVPLAIGGGGESEEPEPPVVNVENKKGVELPETGSIGTIGLTAAGTVIVLLGVFAPRKKKQGSQE